jgi:hypothetical protein
MRGLGIENIDGCYMVTNGSGGGCGGGSMGCLCLGSVARGLIILYLDIVGYFNYNLIISCNLMLLLITARRPTWSI